VETQAGARIETQMSDNASAPAGQVHFMAPVDPETLRAGLGNFARAALAMRRDIELAAEQGDPEARGVLAHEARQTLVRWGRPPPRKRKPPPPGISPRGLSRTEAAAYVGLGTTSFDYLIRAGRLPAPIRVGRRVLWDRGALDAALAAMAGGTSPPAANGAEPNPWDAILGTAP
jgi:excisionase family DNA binding protein